MQNLFSAMKQVNYLLSAVGRLAIVLSSSYICSVFEWTNFNFVYMTHLEATVFVLMCQSLPIVYSMYFCSVCIAF